MSSEQFTLPSFAKINWLLKILGKRDDGFHELCTIFQTVSLKDNLTFAENDKIVLTCKDKNIPTGGNNLIVKAADALREKYKIEKGAKIYLEKNIPAPGGLGGGSSNAAVALIGLAKLWQIETNFAELEKIAKTLGSDVPFFLWGGTAIGTGRGEKILPVEDFEEKYLLIVTPNVAVSTIEAFARLDAPRLTNKSSKSILQICCNEANTDDLWQSSLINDFEESVFKIHPAIELVKKSLFNYGANRALLSGSGASVFAVFDEKKSLENAFENLKNETDWRVFSARTISRQEYLNSFDFGTG